MFLLRQNIKTFIEHSSTSKLKSRQLKECSKSSSNETDNETSPWSVPYSIQLNIDIKFCSEAAVRSGCVCTALILAELADEERKAEDDYISVLGTNAANKKKNLK